MSINKKVQILPIMGWLINAIFLASWLFFPFGGLGFALQRIKDGFYDITILSDKYKLLYFILFKLNQAIALLYFLSTVVGSVTIFYFPISLKIRIKITLWSALIDITILIIAFLLAFIFYKLK